MAGKRCAVIVGVNKTGDLAALESPAQGAAAFGAWLKSEGFAVTTITDEKKPVKAGQIKRAIKKFVDARTYDQLVLYFSGHGYWKNRAEIWLLSDAPQDADAAVSWVETVEYARDCGIPNVVVISDACRSIPTTVAAQRVRGSVVFPNEPGARRTAAKVDQFMASLAGAPAYEIPIGPKGEKGSVFTHCFREAFEAPDADMVLKVTEGDETFEVIPNRKLEAYLRREVSSRLAAINIQLDQLPQAEVVSGDDVYIGRVRRRAAAAPEINLSVDATGRPIRPLSTLPGEDGFGPFSLSVPKRRRSRSLRTDELPKRRPARAKPPIHMHEVASAAVAEALGHKPEFSGAQLRTINRMARTSGFDAVKISVRRDVGSVAHFETETGFSVTGAKVAQAVAAGRAGVEILNPGGRSDPAIVRVYLDPQDSCSLALRFDDGTATVLAALHGYIGHVSVGKDGVLNVSYLPSDNSHRWPVYAAHRDKVEKLRAAVAAAAQFGAFRIERAGADEFAGAIRVEKALDPTLGLYAAYAYTETDNREEVRSLREAMRGDLNADLFDIAMLDRTRSGLRERGGPRVVPFCPMLTQGWNWLRCRRIELPPVLDDAQDELKPALWTTFEPHRAELILAAIERGELR